LNAVIKFDINVVCINRYADNCFQVFYYALVGTLSPEIDELARYIGFLKAVNTGGAALGYGVQVTWSLIGAESIM
jgi:hypothetical protein